jgi:hypothetical protein
LNCIQKNEKNKTKYTTKRKKENSLYNEINDDSNKMEFLVNFLLIMIVYIKIWI